MAIQQRAWRFEVDDTMRSFDGMRTLENVLSDGVGAEIARIRRDPRRSAQLVMVRLAPSDDEEWDLISNPTAMDAGLEQAAAARLMALLIDVCVPAGGLGSRSYVVQELLLAAGWPRERVEVAIRGERLVTYFQSHVRDLSSVADACGNWLIGGWIDASTAQQLLSNLTLDAAKIDDSLPQVVHELTPTTHLSGVELHEILRWGLHDLGSTLASVSTGTVLWMIED
jgi:hypothetical protein